MSKRKASEFTETKGKRKKVSLKTAISLITDEHRKQLLDDAMKFMERFQREATQMETSGFASVETANSFASSWADQANLILACLHSPKESQVQQEVKTEEFKRNYKLAFSKNEYNNITLLPIKEQLLLVKTATPPALLTAEKHRKQLLVDAMEFMERFQREFTQIEATGFASLDKANSFASVWGDEVHSILGCLHLPTESQVQEGRVFWNIEDIEAPTKPQSDVKESESESEEEEDEDSESDDEPEDSSEVYKLGYETALSICLKSNCKYNKD